MVLFKTGALTVILLPVAVILEEKSICVPAVSVISPEADTKPEKERTLVAAISIPGSAFT